jgi:hypothetical protein
MTTAKRKRGRPRKTASAPVRTVPRELPPVPTIEAPAAEIEEALAALDVAEKAAAPAGEKPPELAPAAPASDQKPLELTQVSVSPPAPNGKHATPRERSITGRQYAGLDRKQLRTALALAENRVDSLERQVKDVLPAAAAAKIVALEKMTGVVCSALFDFAALATSIDDVRLDRDEERELGELGAPAIEPYLGEYGKHAPLFAFCAKLTTVVTTKVLIAKAVREQRARDGHRE